MQEPEIEKELEEVEEVEAGTTELQAQQWVAGRRETDQVEQIPESN